MNRVTVKNKYLLLFINKMLNHLVSIKVYIKLNIKSAYNHIHIKKNDEWKTAFCNYYSYFKYLIISFELINALTLF